MRFRITTSIAFSILLLISLMMACSEEKANKAAPAPSNEKFALAGEEIVLAEVNGSPITRYELDLTIRKVLGRNAAGQLDAAGRKKVLESMVASRAISQAQLRELTGEEEAVIEKKVQAYREELLVMRYLAKHAPPQPVTEQMIRDYYEAHPERFGGKTIRVYEMITSSRSVKAQERDNLIEALRNPGEQEDWRQWAENLKTRELPVVFRQGQASEKVLQAELRELMRPLHKGQSSQLTFIKGNAYLVRIVDEKKIEPRPLSEVRADIRKSLVPLQLKKAVKLASQNVLKEANVAYRQPATNKTN